MLQRSKRLSEGRRLLQAGTGDRGGSVYLQTSPSLTSLASVSKRLVGGQGASGSGSYKHGRKGDDVIVTVPVGTVIRELRREGEEERTIREEIDLGLSEAEQRRRRWQRAFVIHPSAGGEVSENEYKEAEGLMKKEGRWNHLHSTPTFEQQPPLILDIDQHLRDPVLLATGGQGGLGNPFFPSPRVASRGFQPPTRTFEFELKLLADVGLVGFPNAGKSTILRALTGRKAEVAGYQFTTLNPQVGVVRVWEDGSWGENGASGASASGAAGIAGEEGAIEVVEETWVERQREEEARSRGEYVPTPRERAEQTSSPATDSTSSTNRSIDSSPSPKRSRQVERIRFTLSDNPGLLPSASANVGLGHSFLRSIERSPVLVYVLDLTRPNPEADLRVLKGELESYKSGLSQRAGVVVLNKGDEVGEDEGREKVQRVHEEIRAGISTDTGAEAEAENAEGKRGEEGEAEGEKMEAMEVVVLSGKYGLGLKRLVDVLAANVQRARIAREQDKDRIANELLRPRPRVDSPIYEERTTVVRGAGARERSRAPASRLGFGLKAKEDES